MDNISKNVNSNNVIHTQELLQYIMKFKDVVISKNDVEAIYNLLSNNNIDSMQNRRIHVNNIKSETYRKEEMIKNNICPQCGEKLVERKGKYGSFMGCSGFPKCRFISK